MIRFLTAGDSHGEALCGIIEGLPAGIRINAGYIEKQLARRRKTAGRSARQKLEKDSVKIIGGMRGGATTGAPVALLLPNAAPCAVKPFYTPRPGHADLAGAIKYGLCDLAGVSERASARETAMTVALACFARKLLEDAGAAIISRTIAIGAAADTLSSGKTAFMRAERSPVRCADNKCGNAMLAEIEKAAAGGETLGGIFELALYGLPCGLGSHAHRDRKFKARLCEAVMSVNGVTGVALGDAFNETSLSGGEFNGGYATDGNGNITFSGGHAAGISGGISTGAPVLIRAAVKPPSSLGKPSASADIRSGRAGKAPVFRSDICFVPSAAVVAEAAAALATADLLLEKFGGDSVAEILPRVKAWRTACILKS
jgi:chorismate synthase